MQSRKPTFKTESEFQYFIKIAYLTTVNQEYVNSPPPPYAAQHSSDWFQISWIVITNRNISKSSLQLKTRRWKNSELEET